jgi:hypothetical protein
MAAGLAAAPAPAAAATKPCWQRVLADWSSGGIQATYAAPCYSQALQHLPTDVRLYSDAASDIRRAMLAALRAGPGPPAGASRVPAGVARRADVAGEAADVGNERSLPLPILGAIALGLALICAGAFGRLRTRHPDAAPARGRPLRRRRPSA